jgi:competence protein ComEA
VLGRAALGLPAPVAPRSFGERLGAIADALGTSPARVVAGLVVALLLVGGLAWTLLATPTSSAEEVAAALPRATTASSSAPAADAGSELVVHAAGAVAQAGVYRLSAGARVADVLDAAGGPTPDADLDQLNLAATVADGDRVYVPRRGEAPPVALSPGAGAGAGSAAGQPVNLNSATAEQLDALVGIGPATARAILDWRQQHGRFRRVDDLLNVRGIGPAKLDALRSQLRV